MVCFHDVMLPPDAFQLGPDAVALPDEIAGCAWVWHSFGHVSVFRVDLWDLLLPLTIGDISECDTLKKTRVSVLL